MPEIMKYNKAINIVPDRSRYFQSLLSSAFEVGLLEADQVKRIQVELLNLLSKQTSKFTSNDSSSVRIEDAESLLLSIYFSIGLALKEKGDISQALELIQNESIEALFNSGNDYLKTYIEQDKRLWVKIKAESLLISNQAYRDTIFSGIKEFFDWYDCKFAAHNTCGSIDYPLVYDTMDLLGIEYIHEYLSHLDMENSFCARFDSESIECLMRGYSKYFKEDLINVYELVLTNLLGRSMLDYSLDELDISIEDRELLSLQLSGTEDKDFELRLIHAFLKIMDYTGITNEDTVEYLKRPLCNIKTRIKKNTDFGRLDKIFITLQEESIENTNSEFVDGCQMEDEDLRLLIDEIKDYRYLSDKVAMVSNSIKSLSDLVEVLNECFFEDEYSQVFKLLDKAELNELKKRIHEDKADTNIEKDWQKEFKLFYKKVLP